MMQVPRDSHLESTRSFKEFGFITSSRVGSYQSTNSGLIWEDGYFHSYTRKFELPSLESVSWSGPLQSACSVLFLSLLVAPPECCMMED